MTLPFRFAKTLITSTLMAATLATASLAHAATTLRLGWTTADSEVDPYAIAARYFKEELETAAPGQFDVKFFPSNQLGNDTDMLQGMQFGTLDAGVITGTQLGTLDRSFQLLDLPFLFKDREQAHQALNGELGKELFSRLDKQGIVGLGFGEAGFRHTINNTREIKAPGDLNGIKLRVQPSDLFIASFRALGANPVPMAWSDAFTAVQQGTVDGLEIPLAVIYANKYAGAVKYLSLTNHTYNALPLLISKQVFSRLSEEQQAAVRTAAEKAIERQRAEVAKNEQQLIEKIKAEGMAVNEVANTQAFREAVRPVYEEYRPRIGADLVDRAMKLAAE
ncbi:TRAP transporter substrate-binding protein [Stutzerimonas tarimensis]|uniref:TRAP transporter substrate-binding protein n=1 Tax=Stutzerimonas tarimensis TaxID=1507735 RepID=A0ABV7T242_9GAMM